ncbi:MAG: T9SS type A sorting domain-containing protein [Flavobacteriales bacterium]|nr:T9SS type A sorting domain-containing protein [Flavobacteriales bacterium]
MSKLSLFLFSILFCLSATANSGGGECIRIIAVDPVVNTVTILNNTNSTIDISEYRMCSLFSYGAISGQFVFLGDPSNLAASEIVIFQWDLNDNAADVALYLPSGAFSDPANMVDFMQYGSAGNGREDEAVEAELWTAGTFVPGANAMVWVGICSDHNVENWFTTSIEEFNTTEFKVGPNPFEDELIITHDSPARLIERIEIYNTKGSLVYNEISGPLTLNRLELNTGSWGSGSYIISVYGPQNEMKSLSVIKQ